MEAPVTILIVETDPGIREQVNALLKQGGYAVVTATTGNEALHIARSNEIALVVVNESLPNTATLHMYRELKRHSRTRFVPVVQLSASTTSEQRAISLEEGADAYISLPYQPRELLAQVRALLRLRTSEQRLSASEENFKILADNIAPLAWMADGEGNIFWFSQRWFDFTGATPEQVKGSGWQDALHPKHVARVMKKLKHCFETGEPWDDTFPLRGRDGSYRWFLSRAKAIHDDEGKVIRWCGTHTDVTDLREVQSRLVMAQRAGKLGGFDWDVRTNRVVWTPELELLLGFPTGGFEGTYDSWTKRVHPEDLPRVEAVVQDCFKRNGTEVEYDFRIRRLDGHWIWMTARAAVTYDANGMPVRLVGINADITERKQSELALRRKEYLLEQATRIAGMGVFEHDHDRGVIKWSEELYRMYGWDPAVEITIPNLLDAVHPEDREAIASAIRAAHDPAGPGIYAVELRSIRADGQTRWFAQRSQTYFEGEGRNRHAARTIGVVLDITDRKESEFALRRTEQDLRQLTEAIPQIVWFTNPNGDAEFINQRWHELTGLSRAETLGEGWVRAVHPDDVAHTMSAWAETIKDGKLFEVEMRLRTRDGTYRWFLSRAVPVRDRTGHIVRWFGSSTDISEIVSARETLARSRVELEKLIAERTAQLRDTVAELEHFSYTITHDMRAPLRAMRAFSEMMQAENAGQLDEMGRDYLARILEASERMDHLITDALSYRKLAREEMPLSPIDPSELLLSMVQNYPEFQPPKAEIEVQPGMPAVMGNMVALTQCFANLIGNAVKFVPEGITPRVRITAERRENNRVRIWISDNGIGIRPEDQERIFDMFYRLSRTYEGTGVGLALVRKAAQRMHGSVGVESAEGTGSRFWIELQAPEKNA